jgi:alanine-glyoxylate transaminase / serine-glyoxylate transaminase / serine-pyruvate transaminase
VEFRSGRHFLQIPRPTNLPDRVLRAIDAPTIVGRGVEAALDALGAEETAAL